MTSSSITPKQRAARRKLAAIFALPAIASICFAIYQLVLSAEMQEGQRWVRYTGTLDEVGTARRGEARLHVAWTDDTHTSEHGTIRVDEAWGQRMLDRHGGDTLDIRVFTPAIGDHVVCPAAYFDACVEYSAPGVGASVMYFALGAFFLGAAVFVRYGKLTR